MDDSIKRNIAKIGIFAALSWIGYKIISGIASDKSSKEIVKETVAPITNAAAEVSKITKKFLKGSPEAKAHMAAIRAKIKKKPATDSEVIKANNLTGKEAVKQAKVIRKENKSVGLNEASQKAIENVRTTGV